MWITEDKLIMTVHSIVYDESGAFGDTNGTTYNFCIYDLESKTKTMTDLPKGTYINRCFYDGEKIYYGAYINDGTLKASTHCYDISAKTDHVILPGNAIFLFDNGVGYYDADGSGKMYSANLKSGETKYLGQGFMNQAFCGMVLYYDGGGYSIYDTASGESKKREDIKGTVLAANGRHILFRGEDGELGAVDI